MQLIKNRILKKNNDLTNFFVFNFGNKTSLELNKICYLFNKTTVFSISSKCIFDKDVFVSANRPPITSHRVLTSLRNELFITILICSASPNRSKGSNCSSNTSSPEFSFEN